MKPNAEQADSDIRGKSKGKGEPTPNRVQSSLLELPRCEGGKDREAGLKEKGEIPADCYVPCLSNTPHGITNFKGKDRKAGLKEKDLRTVTSPCLTNTPHGTTHSKGKDRKAGLKEKVMI